MAEIGLLPARISPFTRAERQCLSLALIFLLPCLSCLAAPALRSLFPSLSDMSDLLEDADEVNEIMGRAYGVPDELNEDDLMDGADC